MTAKNGDESDEDDEYRDDTHVHDDRKKINDSDDNDDLNDDNSMSCPFRGESTVRITVIGVYVIP